MLFLFFWCLGTYWPFPLVPTEWEWIFLPLVVLHSSLCCRICCSVKCFALVLLSSLIFSVSSCWTGNVVDLTHRTRWLVHVKLCALLITSLAVNADHTNSDFYPVSVSVIGHSEVMSRGDRFPAPWLRGRASSSSHGRGRERAGGCQCVRVNQEENTAGVAAGKFTVAALRFYRIMSLTFIY